MAEVKRSDVLDVVKSAAYTAGYKGVKVDMGPPGDPKDHWTKAERKEIWAAYHRGQVSARDDSMAAQGSIATAPATSGEFERIYGGQGETSGQVIAHVHEHKRKHHGGDCDGTCRRALQTHYHVGDRAHRGGRFA